MREILSDIVAHSTPLFPIVMITGTATETKITAHDEPGKSIFLVGVLKTPHPELQGEFGLSELVHLNGLLNFASYKAEGSSLKVIRAVKPVVGETVTEFHFHDGSKGHAVYRTTANMPEPPEIGRVPWEFIFTPTKAKIDEVTKLANLYDVDQVGLETDGGDLVLSFGEDNPSTNSAKVLFGKDVGGSLIKKVNLDLAYFLGLLKLAGSTEVHLSVSNKAILGMTMETDVATYSYYLRYGGG